MTTKMELGERRKVYMARNILVVCSTMRDGNHAVRHQITKTQIRTYAKKAEKALLPVLIVGHGNGLGASSLHLGQARLTDKQMVQAARKEDKRTKIGVFAIPGFATLKDIDMAISEGVDIFQIASHCTEATVTKQYIEYAKKKGKEVYGVLMMSHMSDDISLRRQAELMMDYGTQGIFLMDSAGASILTDIKKRIHLLAYDQIGIPVGFHPH